MFDVLIIGGGVAGLSLASQLAPHVSVALIEAEPSLGYHASGRSAAAYEPNYGLPSTLELTRASFEAHKASGVLSPRGCLLLAKAADKDAFLDDVKTLDLHQISIKDAKAKVPIIDDTKVAFAAHHDGLWDLDTDLLLQSFTKIARSHGAEIICGQKVTSIGRSPRGWSVESQSRTTEAKVLINAAGAWADGIARMAGVPPIGLQPLRRSMGRIPAPGGHDVSGWPMFFGPSESWYAKPDAGALIVSPADEDPTEPHDAFADDIVLAEGFARYEEHVTEPVTRLLSSWAGLRTFAPDRQFVLGRDPSDPSFIWCAGQGGYGFQSCHGAAQYLAEVVLEKPSSFSATLHQQLDPARFNAS